MVASAATYQRGKADSAYVMRKSMDWQRRSLAYIDIVPELAYSSRFYARMLRQLRIYPAILGPDGQTTPIDEGPPVEMLNRIKGRDGTSKALLSAYGRLMFTTGEGNLLALNYDTPDEYWMFVWNDEIEVTLNGDNTIEQLVHKPMLGGPGITYSGEQVRVYRMWTPHPRKSGEADAPMRSVLEIAEELITLTAAVRSTAVSRTVSGMLLMPLEMVPTPAEPIGDEDEEDDIFMDEMLEHFETAIEDAGSAAASPPWVMWGPYELLDRVRKVDLHNPQTDYMEKDLRQEAIGRLARGLDYPAEVLTGLSSANHWAAKQILDDMWRSHGMGIAEQFVGDLGEAYLRKGLMEIGYEGWENVVVAYDASQITVPSDMTDAANAAKDRGEISGEGYRLLMSIPESMAPSKEEHDEYLAIKLRAGELLGVEKPHQSATDPADGPPEPGQEGDSGRKTRETAALLHIGMAEMALARCRELAGIKIKRREKPEGKGKTSEVYAAVLAEINGCPSREIAAKLGPDKVAMLDYTPNDLVKGGADTFRALLGDSGYSLTQSTAIAEMVESYAARTLFMTGHTPLPSGFAAQFERAKEASGGSD